MLRSYRRSEGKFVIKRADLDHKNHDISAEIFNLYPDQRRPSGQTAETADHLLQVHKCISHSVLTLLGRT